VCVTSMKSKTIFLNYFTHDIFSLETMDSHAFSKHWQWVSNVISLQSQSINDGGDSIVFPTLEVKKSSSLPPPPPSLSLNPSPMPPPMPAPKDKEQELSLKKLATDIVIVLAVIVFAIMVLVYFLGFPQKNAVLQDKITELQKEIVKLQEEMETYRNRYGR
ncbi:MAG: hypothetical protein LBL39_03995, partial [Planctomycetaceae bacterium]|nr:hypothetical protein [Planctomycetaceae bacterium]